MNDREFLIWIYERLVNVHGESELKDYMHKFRAIIREYSKNKVTRAVYTKNSLAEMLKALGEIE